MKLTLTVLLTALCIAATAQATLVYDLTTGANGSSPKSLVTYKNKVYFLVRNLTTGFQQLYRSDLTPTATGTGLLSSTSNRQIIGNLAVTDSINENYFGPLPKYELYYVSKPTSGQLSTAYELRGFDGTANTRTRDLSEGLNRTISSPITDVELTHTTQPNSRYPSHINPITTHADNSVFYSNFGFDDNRPDSLLWSQALSIDTITGEQGVFPNENTWFFGLKKKKSDESDVKEDNEPIRGRDDNAQGTRTIAKYLPDTILGIAGGYDDIQTTQFMMLSTLNGVRRLKALNYEFNGLSNNPSEPYFILESDPLSIDIAKRGIYFQKKAYFKTVSNGIWRCDFKKMIPQQVTNNTTADNLTTMNDRAFLTMTTTAAPNGGFYELVNEVFILRAAFASGEIFQTFFDLEGLSFGLTKQGTTYRFYRFDVTTSPSLIGTALNVDVDAGFALINHNVLVFSANNPADGKGQELYRLNFTSPTCKIKPVINNCPGRFNPINVQATVIGGTTANVTIPAFSVTDNCGGTTLKLLNVPQTATYPLGITDILFTATNANGTSACYFQVIVSSNSGTCGTSDNVKPVINNCPAPVVTYFSYDQNDARCLALSDLRVDNDNILPLSIDDNCASFPFPSITSNISEDSCLKPFVTYSFLETAKDSRGNTSTCAFKFKYINMRCLPDTMAPILKDYDCPTDRNRDLNVGETCTTVSWDDPLFLSSECQIKPVLTLSHPKTTCFRPGRTRVTYTATNKSSCSFDVSVNKNTNACIGNNDLTIPTIVSCPASRTVSTKTDSAIITWVSPRFTDNCSDVLVIDSTHESGSKFPIGTTRVVYTATDANNNKNSNCAFNLIVNACVTNTMTRNLTTCNPAQVGTVTQMLTTALGCDSIVITNTTLKRRDSLNVSRAICQGSSTQVGTQTFTLAGIYQINLLNTEGCDSIIKLTLSVNKKDTVRQNNTTCDISQVRRDTVRSQNRLGCDSLTIRVTTFAASDTTRVARLTCSPSAVGVTTEKITRAGRCDSVVITSTTLKRRDSLNVNRAICQGNSLQIGTQTFTLAGIYQINLINTEGCDSIIKLTLAVNKKDTVRQNNTTCDISQVRRDTVRSQNILGCDSLTIRVTTFAASDTTRLSRLTCSPAAVGVTTEKIVRAGRCDSVVIISTTLKRRDSLNISRAICQGNSTQVGTQTFTTAGIYQINLTNTEGCDSIIKLTLAVNKKDTVRLNNTTCDASQVRIDTFRSQNRLGCDSLTIRVTSFAASDTTRLARLTCSPSAVGTTIEKITRAGRCDSVIITSTTLKRRDSLNLSRAICQGSSLQVGTQTFTTTGIYQINLTNTEGCDSIIKLTLAVNKKDTIRQNNTTCDISKVRIDTFRNQNRLGCDSLTIRITAFASSDTTRLARLTCSPSAVGVTTEKIVRAGRCDSIIITSTTLKRRDSLNVSRAICQGSSTQVGTQTFTLAGIYQINLINTEGCDSIIKLTLAVNKKDTIRLITTTCITANVGTDTTRLINRSGCDSLVIRSRVFSNIDTVKPELRNCPTNQTVSSDSSGRCGNAFWTAPTATDNCSTSITITSTQNSGFCFPLGSTTVTYSATDGQNNRATCSFVVTVSDVCTSDTVKPKISNCPLNQTVTTRDTCAFVLWTPPTATDNCRLATFGSTYRSGECFPLGNTPVVYSATDSRGNSEFCRFTITVTRISRLIELDTTISEIKIAPNPTQSHVTLTFDSQIGNSMTFDFYDAIGRHIKQATKWIDKGNNQILFDVQDFPQGVFWISVSFKGQRLSPLRFVKI